MVDDGRGGEAEQHLIETEGKFTGEAEETSGKRRRWEWGGQDGEGWHTCEHLIGWDDRGGETLDDVGWG